MGQVSIGGLSKANFIVYEKFSLDGRCETEVPELAVEFQFNPASLTTKQENTFTDSAANQDKTMKEYESSGPVCLTIPDVWFDTYEDRVCVRKKYIDKLESLMIYNKTTHVLPVVVFNWGKFSEGQHAPDYVFYIKSLSVDYTLFLNDGMAVRAKVNMGLEQIAWKEKNKQSPDHAKVYFVRQGDTLQAIAQREYENPGEWRRIAKLNNIIDPLELRPGTKLLVPPILK